ncbi:MAG: 5-oxoprolinase subunit PxpA [Bacteroidales bacterium]|nr:5-oxoprolinase subunit PxpA [Bacteroidales bacterium]
MTIQISVDLNADLGEGFGNYRAGNDPLVMKYISSANIACGFHAGDPPVILNTIRLAKEAGVAVGAHPGYPDMQGFGRRTIRMSRDELYAFVLYQTGALKSLAEALGTRLVHVKPHGALYNDAVGNTDIAAAIAEAVYDMDPELLVFGPPNSALENEALQRGLRFVIETFADRAYNSDGTLVPRGKKGAVIYDTEEVAERALAMVRENRIPVQGGGSLLVKPDTICIHGDNPAAVAIAERISQTLIENGVVIKPVI